MCLVTLLRRLISAQRRIECPRSGLAETLCQVNEKAHHADSASDCGCGLVSPK